MLSLTLVKPLYYILSSLNVIFNPVKPLYYILSSLNVIFNPG